MTEKISSLKKESLPVRQAGVKSCNPFKFVIQTKKDKIFQPFFTTKPTGSGTGLGLLISYDIIRVHEGEIMVNSEEGKGTTFVIKLPISN